MKALAVLVVLWGVLASSACTNLNPREAPPEELQRQLLSGELLEPGDRVKLVTTDGTVYEFRVTGIDYGQGLVIGTDERVPIADVVAVQTREVSVGKTALLVGTTSYLLLVLALFAVTPALILAGA